MARLTHAKLRDWSGHIIELSGLDIEALAEGKPITQLDGNKQVIIIERYGHRGRTLEEAVNTWREEDS